MWPIVRRGDLNPARKLSSADAHEVTQWGGTDVARFEFSEIAFDLARRRMAAVCASGVRSFAASHSDQFSI